MNAVLADSGGLSSSIHFATSLALLRACEQSAAAFNRIARRLSALPWATTAVMTAPIGGPTTAQNSVPLIRSRLSLENSTSGNLGTLNKDYGRTSSR
jgi:hypothetical protein